MKDRLAKGAAWLVAAKIIVNLLALLSTLVLARLLIPEDFGLVALATAMLTIISAFTDLSLASALIHHKEPTEVHLQTAWTLNFSRSLLVGVIFYAVAPLTAKIYGDPRLIEVMYALSVSVVLSGLINPKTVLLTKSLVFWQEFVLTVSQKFVGVIVGVGIAFAYKSYWALVGGMIASQFIGIVVSYLIIPFIPKFSVRHARELWSFSVWLTLGQIVNTLNWKLDHLLIGGYLGKPALGYYTVGDNLAAMTTRETIGPLETTLFPGFASIAHDQERLKNAYRKAQTFITALALPIGVGCALIAYPLVLLGMGEKWLPAVDVIEVLACIFALQTMGSAAHPLAMAKGQTQLLFHRDLLSFCIRVPIIILGMYLGGLLGIIYARAVTGVIAIMINMHLVRRLIGIRVLDQLSANARSLLSVIGMAASVIALEYLIGRDGTPMLMGLKMAFFVTSGAVVYVSLHLLFWCWAKKPIGPETEILSIATKLFTRIKFLLLKH